MAISHRTYRYFRSTHGTVHHKNIYSNSFGYTETRKKVSAASNTAVLAATAASAGAQKTVTSGITDPDVPRALKVVPGGTTADILDSVVEVFGTNVEGKTISERFRFAAGASSAVEGIKAFKTVSSVVIDGQLSTAATFSVGTTNKLGVNHRLFPSNTTVKVYADTAVDLGEVSGLTLQAQPTVVADGNVVENNLVTPATTPDGTTFLVLAYSFDNWALAPVNDEPEYSTSTSTSSTSSSTSTTTATTTSTSTSSTSSSTSSTSISTSSTSSSTSSTSTSTTTVP